MGDKANQFNNMYDKTIPTNDNLKYIDYISNELK